MILGEDKGVEVVVVTRDGVVIRLQAAAAASFRSFLCVCTAPKKRLTPRRAASFGREAADWGAARKTNRCARRWERMDAPRQVRLNK